MKALNENAIEEVFVRASGPGGQNVNKVSSAVQLRFHLAKSGLAAGVLARLKKLAGRRVSGEGVLTIIAQSHRTQEANRRDARLRLTELLLQALTPPKVRRATRPTRASKVRRIEGKKHRGGVKSTRAKPAED